MPSVRMANPAASYRLLEAGQYRVFPYGQGHHGLILGSFPPCLAVTAGIRDGLSWRDPLFSGGGRNHPKIVQRACRALDGDSGMSRLSARRLAFRSVLGKSHWAF